MLEFYVARHKRWKNRARTKKRRRQLNTVPDSSPREWGPRYITNVSRSSRRRIVVPTERYHRYLNSHLGEDVGAVYSKLSHMKMYRGSGRHEIKKWFADDMQRERHYRRDEHNRLELVPTPEERPLPQLEGHIVSRDGWLMARVHVWYPYWYSGKVQVTGIGEEYSKQSTPYLYYTGWWGLYVETYEVYKYELVVDSEGRPCFTKEEYEIKKLARDSRYTRSLGVRTIPVGGPLLRESVRTESRYEWKMVPDWEIKLCGSRHR